MQKLLIEYKGVILFFLSIVIVFSVWSNRVKELNATVQNENIVVNYEK